MRSWRQHQESQPHHMQLLNNATHFFELSMQRRYCIAYREPARQWKNDPILVSVQSHNDLSSPRQHALDGSHLSCNPVFLHLHSHHCLQTVLPLTAGLSMRAFMLVDSLAQQ